MLDVEAIRTELKSYEDDNNIFTVYDEARMANVYIPLLLDALEAAEKRAQEAEACLKILENKSIMAKVLKVTQEAGNELAVKYNKLQAEYNQLAAELSKMRFMMGKPKLALNAKETATVLGISTSKAYQLFKATGFPVVRIGSRIVIPIDRLNLWLDKQANVNAT